MLDAKRQQNLGELWNDLHKNEQELVGTMILSVVKNGNSQI
jgi:hypothetical protein